MLNRQMGQAWQHTQWLDSRFRGVTLSVSIIILKRKKIQK